MTILEGKSAIVTGAGGGIGRGHALHLARAGAAVVVNDIDGAAAAAVVSEIESLGARAIASTHDISGEESSAALVKSAVDAFGGIDILVNNAGNLKDRTFLKMTGDEFDAVWRVHVKGTFWCAQHAARRMVEQGRGGALINTTSAAHFGSFGQTNYAAAKGAIASMTYTWALELARYGIRVNAVSPLGMSRMSATTKPGEGVLAVQPDPTLNGPMIVFLASDEADFVSGQVFGTGGDRIALLSQPHYGKTLIRSEGWDLETIQAQFRAQMRGAFGALGMLGQPYPFHDGVKRPVQEHGR
ncbi:SDR family NAD(P)-dependent oxidoreductase [Sphingomonas sp. C3-2]|uniref:SDR family NAD(P)-dependent oxidoreductase n=1 Tax=Sphingomonas sp. C3-2 TaxID=3062169 RepID=UPI00294B650A|nr:SDR family NAD(P)-dependent oxidoreductase [Sphingomonas sp. C3-2]WOK36725.1 SDR family NAD(P)-dependent oxidoreductase [Sphingomonas sp. C3-2]